jgi:hypothetical protein
MTQRRFHYEQAFEHYLRANRIPYIAVDEAKKSLLPAGADLPSIKSFDFVVYGQARKLLIDVKGRMFGSVRSSSCLSNRRFESWVTREDVESLEQWQRLFGPEFESVFVFAYCLRQQPPDALFEVLFAFGSHWYALREITLTDYRRHMVTRSSKWGTVHVPAAAYRQASRPFTAGGDAGCSRGIGPVC